MQLLLGHTKLENTVRYLGIEIDDALELAEQTDIRNAIGREVTIDDGRLPVDSTHSVRFALRMGETARPGQEHSPTSRRMAGVPTKRTALISVTSRLCCFAQVKDQRIRSLGKDSSVPQIFTTLAELEA